MGVPVCLSLCVCVCLSNLKYPEREVVSPRCLYRLEEFRLARCINCFSSLYDGPFQRNSVWNFSASYARYLEREVVSPRCLHRLQVLLIPGEFHKLLFKPIRHAIRKKKRLEVFRKSRAKFRARALTLPVSLGKINLAPYKEAFATF